MVVYLSGQITGLSPEKYKENFEKAQKYARVDIITTHDETYTATSEMHFVNPVNIGEELNNDFFPFTPEWSDYMKACLYELLKCDAIYMLQGFMISKGAKLEHKIAKELGLKVFYQSPKLATLNQEINQLI